MRIFKITDKISEFLGMIIVPLLVACGALVLEVVLPALAFIVYLNHLKKRHLEKEMEGIEKKRKSLIRWREGHSKR
jgi:hypothetical protein